jgi:hypothetical protein
LLFVSIKDLNQFQFLVDAKYKIAKNFNLLAGPSVGFSSKFNQGDVYIGLDFGASYNVTEKFSLDAKYNLGLNNLLKHIDNNSSSKLSGIFVGVGYKF